ncbi:MAG: hypothetical protein IKO71_05365 [Bacteroidaceae bacterium]|nr:hypothetical protein [Bacteroidaceae bacterium]
MKKHVFWTVLTAATMFCGGANTLSAQTEVNGKENVETDLMSDTWVATDALGRQMPLNDLVGDVRTDHRRVVGIFYITWHTPNNHNLKGPYTDVTKILHEDPMARKQGSHPLWKYGSYHWGEPEVGYFLSQDEWVIRHDISMLQDAGVDVLVMDVTNGVCYWDEWEVLFSTMMKMREEGNRTPQFVFWSYNNKPVNVVKQLYERYYQAGKYKDLWFYWDGKPLLLYNADPSSDANGKYKDVSASDYPQEILDYFTLRNMWWGYYESKGKRYIGTEDNWSFGYQMDHLDIVSMTPQQLVSKHKGQLEEAAVTPAQHPLAMDERHMGVGKSWSRHTLEPELDEYDMPRRAYVPWLGKTVDNPTGYGIYFQERWDDALAADPQFIYLNDWNEWTAGKYGWGDNAWFMNRPRHSFVFVDQYNAEFNRTIQPMKDGYTDNFYMQMAQNIRRYKGARPIPVNKGYNKIGIDGDFSDWESVTVVYRDTRGDVTHRDADGYAGLHYTDQTGRNDLQDTKVALTKKGEVAFYVKTGSPITPHTDPNWMLLLIDADQNSETGWYGYDLLVNERVLDNSTAVMRYSDGMWVEQGNVPYAVNGCELELSIPAQWLGVKGNSASFDFKWADNPQELETPISLCTHGDTAPNRRFNYRFIWKKK